MRILAFAESFTASHIIRPLTLLEPLSSLHEIHFACSNFHLPTNNNFHFHDLTAVSTQEIKSRLAWGKNPFPSKNIDRQIQEDLDLIQKIKPDFVLGDMRLSLGISSKLSKVTSGQIINAYWSPYTQKPLHAPQTRYSKFISSPLYLLLFRYLKKHVIQTYLDDINRLRDKYELQMYQDYFELFTDADHIFYPDIPALIPIDSLPLNHYYIGHIHYSKGNLFKESISALKPTQKIFISFGSSGDHTQINKILSYLSKLSFTVIVALADAQKKKSYNRFKNVYFYDYVDIEKMADQVNLVICHGGSSLTYPFLSKGVPLVCIPSNSDQFLSADAVCKFGAGEMIRPESITMLPKLVCKVLENPQYQTRAMQLAQEFKEYEAHQRFSEVINSLLN